MLKSAGPVDVVTPYACHARGYRLVPRSDSPVSKTQNVPSLPTQNIQWYCGEPLRGSVLDIRPQSLNLLCLKGSGI